MHRETSTHFSLLRGKHRPAIGPPLCKKTGTGAKGRYAKTPQNATLPAFPFGDAGNALLCVHQCKTLF